MTVEVTVLDLSAYGHESVGYQVEVDGEYIGEVEPLAGFFYFVKHDDYLTEEPKPIRVSGFKPEWTPEQTASALQMILNSSIGKKVLA